MLGSSEFLVIAVVALIVIGPKKLPELMRSLGKGLSEFKRMSMDVKSALDREVEKADFEKRKAETQQEMFGEKPAPAGEAQPAPAPEAAGEAAPKPATAPEPAQPAAEAPVAGPLQAEATPAGQDATGDKAQAQPAGEKPA